MEVRLNSKEQEEIQELAENLEGVTFSGDMEFGGAIKEVTPEDKGVISTLVGKIKKLFGSSTKSNND